MQLPMWLFFGLIFLSTGFGHSNQSQYFKQLGQYAVLFVFNLFATSALLWLLSDKIGIIPAISKVLVMGLVVCWNLFCTKRLFINRMKKICNNQFLQGENA